MYAWCLKAVLDVMVNSLERASLKRSAALKIVEREVMLIVFDL